MTWGSKADGKPDLLEQVTTQLEQLGFALSRDTINGTATQVFRSQTRPTMFVSKFSNGINILAFVKLNREASLKSRLDFLSALNEMNCTTIAMIVSCDDERIILSHWMSSCSQDGMEAFIRAFDHDMEAFVKTSILRFTR